jgi:outer membrane protein assembly factor BamB
MRRLLWIVGVLCFSLALARADWPDYRGPWQDGHASAPGDTKPLGLPLHWGEGENVKWKTPIPYRGWSTPVVLDGQVWLTTATEDGHDFFALCVDADSGKVRFNEKLFHSDHPEPLGNPLNGYASPSPAIEPGRVYVHFGSYGTACLDTATAKVLWERHDLPCRHYRGPGSSPLLYKDLLILTMDGVDVQYVTALDKKSGETVWKTNRSVDYNDLDAQGKPKAEGDLRKGYGTPLIIEVNGKPQLLSAGAKAVYGYDPLTGRELWQVRHAGHSSAARALFSHGRVYLSTGFGKTEMLAFRADGQGDLTDSNVIWRVSKGAPQMPSPVLVDDLLFMVSDNGIATCLEAETGKEVWTERVGGQYAASLLYGDGRVYCFSQEGKTTVLKAARTPEVLATNTLEAGFMASPAASGKALFLRTKTHLYRIEDKE